MRRRSPTKAESEALAARIVAVQRADPGIERQALAERFGCHLNTIRDALRAAGLYTPRGSGRTTSTHKSSTTEGATP